MKLLLAFAIVATAALNTPSVSANFVGGFGTKARLPYPLKNDLRHHGGPHCSYQEVKDKLAQLQVAFDCYQGGCDKSEVTTNPDEPTPTVSSDTVSTAGDTGSSPATFTEGTIADGDDSSSATPPTPTTSEGPVARAHAKAKEHGAKLKSRGHGASKAKHDAKTHAEAKHHSKSKAHDAKNKSKQ